MSAERNSVPCSRKTMKHKQNYGPTSLFIMRPWKIDGTRRSYNNCNWNHISEHNIGHSHQWAYEKGHTPELLFVKMIDGGLGTRRALDDKNLVLIDVTLAVNIRKAFAFAYISQHVLLQKLQMIYCAGLRITLLTALKLQS